ncbi:MAG: aldehyde dehydrogenase family protein [bacterium]
MDRNVSRHLIGGEWVNSGNGVQGRSIDPATEEVVGLFADGGRSEALQAISAARNTFGNAAWSQGPRLRQEVLLAWAAALERSQKHLAHLLTLENGKPLGQSLGEIAGAVSEIRYYAGLARHMPGHVLEVEPGVFSTMIREPAGVCGIIVPWNAPVVLLIRSLAPALAAGCTAVVKPAPQTTLISAALLRELAEVKQLPDGVVNMVSETGHAVAETLVESDDVQVISFTGSSATGKKIMAAAAATMKKLSLELGGKSCCLVFEDADVGHAAPALAAAATIIAGQQCTAARRILVHTSRYEEMKNALKSAFKAVVVGSGLDPASQMGPLIDEAAYGTVRHQVNAAMEACDEVVLRGGRPASQPEKGFFLTPSLIAHSDPDAFFCQEEIFGPLLVIEPFSDEADVIAKANRSVFGLSASVWTRDGARAWRVARALKDGTVWVNDHNKLFAEAETGGYRHSGVGRLHGHNAFADFTELKHIYQNVGVAPQ